MAWRDTLRSALFGNPVTPGKTPSPALMDQGFGELESAIAAINAQIEEVASEVVALELEADSILKATWAELAAISGTRDGQRAFVPNSDGGTHTDPVVGGTVDNAGTYSWSGAEEGWERVDDYQDVTGVAEDLSDLDNAVVKLAGDQTVGGVKTFSSAPIVPDDAFGISKVANLTASLAAKLATSIANARSAYGGPIVLLNAAGTNTITADLPAAFAGVTIVDDTTFLLRAPANNTGAVTLNGLPLNNADDQPLVAGDLRTARRYVIRYSTFGSPHYLLVAANLLRSEVQSVDNANARSKRGVITLITEGTGTNTISATLPTAFAGVALEDETIVTFRAPADNTGAVTLMGLPLRQPDGVTELQAGELRFARRYQATYSSASGGNFRLLSGMLLRSEVDAQLNTQVSALRNALTSVSELAGVYSPLIPLIERLGGFYNFMDRYSLWQDAAGTIPVRKSGDRIGRVDDLSGNGYHFAAESDVRRPTWLTDVNGLSACARVAPGGDPSTAQFLTGVKKDMTRNRQKMTIFALVAVRVRGGINAIIYHATAGAAPGSTRVGLHINNYRPAIQVRQSDSTSVAANSWKIGGTYLNYHWGDWLLLEAQVDFAGGALRLFSDGANTVDGVKALPASAPSVNTNEAVSYISHPTNRLDGDIASIVEIVGDVSDRDRAGIYEYFANLAAPKMPGDLLPYDPTGPLPVVFFWFNAPHVIPIDTDEYLVGGVDPGGTVMAGHYDFNAGTVSHAVLHSMLEVDDHNIPSFCKLPDGHVIAVYSKHNGGGEVFLTKTVTAGNYSAWTTPVDIGPQLHFEAGHTFLVSYDFLFRHSGEGDRLYFVHRQGDATAAGGGSILTQEYWVISWSDDDGATWTRGKKLWGPMRPYTRVWSNGVDRLDFFFNDSHPNEDMTNRVWHCYLTGGNFYKSDGTLIGDMDDLPIAFGDATLVFDANAATVGNAWVWDLTYDEATGRPVGTFATYNTDYSVIKYFQARWTGAAWTQHEITAAGASISPNHNVYAGGVVQDPADTNAVYASIMVTEAGAITTDRSIGVHQIFKLVTADGGATWTKTQLTFGPKAAFRPVIAPGGGRLFYVTGDYGPHYSEYLTHVESLEID